MYRKSPRQNFTTLLKIDKNLSSQQNLGYNFAKLTLNWVKFLKSVENKF